jgi:predicted Fe-Mo cluster-binding NifX family protein
MMIAVPSSGRAVCEHFGHCENFNLYEARDGAIVSEKSVPNPGHKPGFLPNFLADMGVTVVVAGGMGGGAVTIFQERGVEVVSGASGDARQSVEKYLKGELKSTGAVCHEHKMEHEGHCGQ